MKLDKSKQPIDYLMIMGVLMVGHASMTQASGPYTRALKIFENLCGTGCCIASLVKQAKERKNNDQSKK